MAIDRKQWLGRQSSLERLCPRCQSGHFTLIDATKNSELTADAWKTKASDEWEFEWLQWRFVALMRCSNSTCQETAAVSGEMEVEEFQITSDDYTHLERFRISSYRPSPTPFLIDRRYPVSVSAYIRAASEVYWSDAEAAANKVRQAVEAFLTDRQIKQYVLPGGKNRTRLSLHARIDLYAKAQPEMAKLLFAVKWLGNAGSHVGGLSHEDVLDGFEMLEHVLHDTFVNDRKRLIAKALQINRKKGPVRK